MSIYENEHLPSVVFADAAELAELEVEPPAPLVEHPIRIDRRARAALWGPANSMKTWLELLICLLIARAGGSVVLCSGEGALGPLAARIRALALGLEITLSDLGRSFVVGQGSFELLAPESRDGLGRMASDLSPDLIALDPWISFTAGLDENAAGQVALALRVLEQPVDQHGSSVLLVHHARKDGRALRGSSVFDGWLDASYSVTPNGKRPPRSTVECTKTRWGAAPPPISFELVSEGDAARLEVLAASGGSPTPRPEKYEAVLDFIAAAQRPVSQKAVRDALSMSGSGAQRALDALVDAGEVEVIQAGRGSRKTYRAP